MRQNRNDRRLSPLWSDLLMAAVLTMFLFSASVVIVLNFKPLYYLDIPLLGIERLSGMSKQDILANYDALIRYNRFYMTGPLVFPTLGMSEHGRIHFQEVKMIFVLIQYLCMGSGVAALFGMIIKRKQKGCRYWKITGILGIVIPTVLGILAVFWWEQFFITFHQIFFRNNYWLFYPETDPVILMLPDGFFMHCAILILLLILAGSCFCLWIQNRRNRKEQEKYNSNRNNNRRNRKQTGRR